MHVEETDYRLKMGGRYRLRQLYYNTKKMLRSGFILFNHGIK